MPSTDRGSFWPRRGVGAEAVSRRRLGEGTIAENMTSPATGDRRFVARAQSNVKEYIPTIRPQPNGAAAVSATSLFQPAVLRRPAATSQTLMASGAPHCLLPNKWAKCRLVARGRELPGVHSWIAFAVESRARSHYDRQKARARKALHVGHGMTQNGTKCNFAFRSEIRAGA